MRVSRLRTRGLGHPRGLRQLWKGSEGQEGFGEGSQLVGSAPGLSSVRHAAGGSSQTGGVQPRFADVEMRHGEGRGLGRVMHRQGEGYPFAHPQALDLRPGTAGSELSLGELSPGGEERKPTTVFSSGGSRSHPQHHGCHPMTPAQPPRTDFTLMKGAALKPEVGAQPSPRSPRAPVAPDLTLRLLAASLFPINHHYQTPGDVSCVLRAVPS